MFQPITVKMTKNKHDEVTFQLAAVDLNCSTLMVQNLCDRHCILKDNNWMGILHEYHKASELKLCTEMCREQEEFLGNFQYGGDHIFRTIANTLFFCIEEI